MVPPIKWYLKWPLNGKSPRNSECQHSCKAICFRKGRTDSTPPKYLEVGCWLWDVPATRQNVTFYAPYMVHLPTIFGGHVRENHGK